jgi:hypothetical protein
MVFTAPVEEYLQRIKSYSKENLADVLHEISEAVPLITHQPRFRLYLEDLTGGILNCVLATGRTRQVMRDYVFTLTDENYLVSRVYIEQQDTEIFRFGELVAPGATTCRYLRIKGLDPTAVGAQGALNWCPLC